MNLATYAGDDKLRASYLKLVMNNANENNPEAKSNDNTIGNDIRPPFKDVLPVMEVTDEAERLSCKFKNTGWVPFYAKVIIWLGFERVHLIESRVSDSKYPAQLFTKIAKQEIESVRLQLINKLKIEKFKRIKNGSDE